MSASRTLVRIDPTVDQRWEELMRGSEGSLFGSPPWLRAISRSYDMSIVGHLLVNDEGRTVAGLAHVELDDLCGRRRVSVPFVDRLEPVVGSLEDWGLLTEPLFEPVDGHVVPLTFRTLDGSLLDEDDRLHRHHELAWHATALGRSVTEIEASLHPSARANVRKARRFGVAVEMGDALEHVRAFHRLHRTTRRVKYGLLAQPLAFFEEIWRQFAPSGSIEVALARLDGEIIAGAMYLRWNDVYYYKFGASIAGSLHVRPNELVHLAGLTSAVASGCRTFDWGVSDLDQPGLVRYKRKFATDERRVVVHKGGDAPADERLIEARRLLGQLTNLLTAPEVPDEVTAKGGDLLYRYFA